MRLLAIGDIHGCYRALTTVVEAAGITGDDMLITLGDYVDRGPNTCAVLDWLVARSQQGNLIALRGNHELMMSRASLDPGWRDDWLVCGGAAALASYPTQADAPTLDDIPESHWEFVEDFCRDWYETETHIFVHAGLTPEMAVEEQAELYLFWEKFRDPPPHCSGKIMVCGHTPQKSGKPRNIGHAVCIDTFVYGDGWLTCLDVASGQYWQANQQGESRTDWLQV